MVPSDGFMIVLLLLCVALSAFFSASETAYSAINRLKLKTMQAEGKKNAGLALSLAEQYDRLLTTILIGNNIVNIAATAIATVLFTRLCGGDLGATVSTVVMTIVVLIFGEVSPKTLAKQNAEKVAMAVAVPLKRLMWVLAPADRVFSLIRNALHQLFHHDEDEYMIEEELKTMVDEAQSEGDMDAHEGELIRSAIEFNDQDAASILTPRVDITAIEDTATMAEAADLFRESGYSRLPVYHDDMDHIVGILHEKDFYIRQHAGCNDIKQIMVSPVWAPGTLNISKLLKLFQASQTHMVILLDEFGGTLGLVTMQDVLQELVGEIYDEHDEKSIDMAPDGENAWIVDGSMQLDEMLQELNIENEYEADTVGGWAGEMLGRIPTVGERFTAANLQGTVTIMDKRRVVQLRIERIHTLQEDEENVR